MNEHGNVDIERAPLRPDGFFLTPLAYGALGTPSFAGRIKFGR